MAGLVAFGGGLVAWRAWEETGRTVTGPASDGASGILVTPLDGHAFTVYLPAGEGADPAVMTSGWVGLSD
jgi:hypothetical protein